MIDLFLVMNDTYTVVEVLTAGDQPHRLAWLRRVPNSIGDWEVWTSDVIPADRHILERFPDVGAGSAQWRAVEWCRVHWEQLLTASAPHTTPEFVACSQRASMMGVHVSDIH
ncbi:hypothetical protein [Pseudoclavibacter sp. 13-3]|uniref:hypothetical protein n=1 Tax=Pseudoclavibacter sp. 13-3 TaxID=2901228 RepID=UPI001E3996CD|nr:hypothetical protein [Pseudoclavibacter sp. 13-3]MCD7100437.1 hypothetical protein [Pseudoclavibacter sp. 13-3]